MSSIAPPKSAALTPEQRPATAPASPGKAAEAAERGIADHATSSREVARSNELQVRLDEEAGRFVQTLTDVSTEETVRRYPSEAQLAYSRAVMAYLKALSGVNKA